MGSLVWLASYPRSGNTWTRNFLHNLLNIVENGGDQLSINEMDERSTWDIGEGWYRPFIKKPPNEASKEEVAAARPLAQKGIADRVDGPVFVKTHAALVKDRGTASVNMSITSGAIYIVRNPLDVTVSFAHHMGQPFDAAIEVMNTPRYETPNGPNAVYEVYGSWSEHVESWTRKPHPAIMVLQYEEMLAQPEQAFSNLAEHLRIAATAEQVTDAIRRSDFSRLSQAEDEGGFRERPKQSDKRFFREGRAGQWQDVLSQKQIGRIVSAHRSTMERFGYLPGTV